MTLYVGQKIRTTTGYTWTIQSVEGKVFTASYTPVSNGLKNTTFTFDIKIFEEDISRGLLVDLELEAIANEIKEVFNGG